MSLPDGLVHGSGEAPHSARLLIYSQDGLGLGHMRRTNSIAAEFLRHSPDSAVLTVEDSPRGNLFRTTHNHDFVKLPSIQKLRPGEWRATGLPLSFDEVRGMREEIIRSIVLRFRPDLLLVDHMPHGAMGELKPALLALRDVFPESRVVLGLRDILDAPKVIKRRWRLEGAYEAVERWYHQVLVYGRQDVFDVAREYRFPPAVAAKLRYCGYVCTQETPRYPETVRARHTSGANAGAKLLVAMAGGGADGFPLMSSLLDALPRIMALERVSLVLITGPFMPPGERRDLQTRAAGLPVMVRPSVSDPLSYIAAADLVVAMAGYNTTMEILRAARPALLIPRAGPSSEQRTRVRLFKERGWIRTMDPDDLAPEPLADAIVEAIRAPHSSQSAELDLDGVTTAVGHLLRLTAGARQERAVASGNP